MDDHKYTKSIPLASNVPFSAKGMAVLGRSGDKYFAFEPGGGMSEIVGWDISDLVKALRDQGIMVLQLDIALPEIAHNRSQ